MKTLSPARLHVLIARDAPSALVIRRGRAKQVCTLSWDRTKDLVTLAQWMSGRVYERRCDLSPDGRHWIYFAMNGHWSSESKGSWTAVASAPWLKARVFLPQGDCWQGGGLFLFLDEVKYEIGTVTNKVARPIPCLGIPQLQTFQSLPRPTTNRPHLNE